MNQVRETAASSDIGLAQTKEERVDAIKARKKLEISLR